jgi:4-diphosphocytidyl-2-C-methyl-D-erythritol kinase
MNGQSADWPAPAKINRFLHITGQRPDGYHDLQTLFQFIEPCDRLGFTLTDSAAITRQGGLAGLAPADDLVVRAARALQAASGHAGGVEIRVDKRIPAGGGLGGGSSDAATTLVALNALWGCGLSGADLEALGLGLGADVPVFVRGRSAWAEGVGDRLTGFDADRPWLVVLDPGVEVSTAAVFGDGKLTRHTERITMSGFQTTAWRNDCEAVVRRLYPPVARAIDALSEYGPTRLTGTGGCLFACFGRRGAAERARQGVRDLGTAWVTRAANRSPLLERLEAQQASSNGA